MIRSVRLSQDGQIRTGLGVDEIAAALKDTSGLLWVDLRDEPAEVSKSILRETFGFHPLAVDDAVEETHVPKVDDWEEYVYLVLRAVVFDDQGEEELGTPEVDVFLGRGYLVTYQSRPIAAVDRVWSACQRDQRHLRQGATHLLYKLADELVADYLAVVEEIDAAIDEIEDQVFTDPQPELLERIFVLKRGLLHLRRIIAPQREVLSKLARGDYVLVEPRSQMFFRDVYDHLVRLHDITESMRDLVGSALDTYLSVTSNRMNEAMKVLTVIATIFMPLSFIAGVYGMNFHYMPELGWRLAYPAVWLIMLGISVLMLIYFRRRGWL
jgi:magnesium transporter